MKEISKDKRKARYKEKQRLYARDNSNSDSRATKKIMSETDVINPYNL